MLRSLSIRNYRLFKSLTLPTLGRLNLVVGGNNSGKSCLLEAVRIFEEGGHPHLLHRLIRQRHEDIEALTKLDGEGLLHPDLSDPLRNLFLGRRFPDDTVTSIRIGEASDGGRLVELHLSAEHRNDEDKTRRRISMREARMLIDEVRFYLDVRIMEHAQVLSRRSLRLGGSQGSPSRLPSFTTRYVPASGWNQTQINRLWSRVAIRPTRKKRILEAIQLIDPDIMDIVLLPDGSPIAVYDDVRQTPLRGMGDGIGRLFQIALAMVSSDSNVVLLDEFENGLHWSVQDAAWRFVFSLAEATDTQVFATTHSWDCVQAFQKVDAEHPETAGMLFHLGRSVRTSNRGQIIANAYDSSALRDIVQADIEVR